MSGYCFRVVTGLYDIMNKKPEWTPKNAGSEFASSVVSGNGIDSGSTRKSSHIYTLPLIEDLVQGVLKGNRTMLAKAITIIESNAPKHFDTARALVNALLPYYGKSIRIGITGTPGAGKSSFIESFGLWLIERGHKVAVLAIDPSSTISKGSILGDKTRMEKLSSSPHSFIRPSPSSGVLGGVARKTRESIIMCEAAGFDIILVETVGVGQSEVSVRSMVDYFLLMQISGAGDELQGIKKGVMELADLIVVNKTDGDNVLSAKTCAGELNNVLHYISKATKGWQSKALTASALLGEGLDDIWQDIEAFVSYTRKSGIFELRRKEQNKSWFDDMLIEQLKQRFFAKPGILKEYEFLKQEVTEAKINPVSAVHKLLDDSEASPYS